MKHASHFSLNLRIITICIIIGFCPIVIADDSSTPNHQFNYGQPRQMALLASPFIRESSGLAWGWKNKLFWTHNDSGSGSQIFAFDITGKNLGHFTLKNTRNVDWEDMASFQLNDKNYLLIGDIGNNFKTHRNSYLYLIEEPDVPRTDKFRGGSIQPIQTITFKYDDGPHDCESLAVDPTTKTIYLLTKNPGFYCTLYTLPIPEKQTNTTLIAKTLCEVEVTIATAMDMSPDGKRLIIQTYADAFEFTRRDNQTWLQALDEIPRQLKMPQRDQGESICFGPDGKTLYLTSEKRPTPLWEVPITTTITTNANNQTQSQSPHKP